MILALVGKLISEDKQSLLIILILEISPYLFFKIAKQILIAIGSIS